MKKFILLLATLLTLVSCDTENTEQLKIVTPTGAPAIAFYTETKNEFFETNSVPSNIVAMMTSNSDKDVVVIDTISGIKAINNGAPYKIAASITLGNFFIVSTGTNANIESNDYNGKIILFGQKQTPDYMFHYLYGNSLDEKIEFVTNVQDAGKCLAAGKNPYTGSPVDFVFIAQPVLFKILSNQTAPTYGKAFIYQNIQTAYKEKTNGLNIIQASVFIKDDTNKRTAQDFLKNLEKNIKIGIETPEIIKDSMNQISPEESTSLFGIDSETVYNVMKNNDMGLGYLNTKQHKSDIDSFISIFNVEKTNEKIYF